MAPLRSELIQASCFLVTLQEQLHSAKRPLFDGGPLVLLSRAISSIESFAWPLRDILPSRLARLFGRTDPCLFLIEPYIYPRTSLAFDISGMSRYRGNN